MAMQSEDGDIKPAEVDSLLPSDNDDDAIKEPGAAEPSVENPKSAGEHKFHHHQAQIFNELLEKTAPEVKSEGPTYRHPVIIDALLALGLLVAMAGFTLGAVKIYIVHEARHDITDRRYSEAIILLKSAPLPGLFQVGGESPEDLLDQANYLDAIEKLDIDKTNRTALRELDAIRPGSKFFEMANNIKGDHAPPSPITLESRAEHVATPAEIKGAERPFPAPERGDK